MAILEVKNIEKHFGNTKVLKDVSFSLEEGNTLAIIGSSGSGKTTLIEEIIDNTDYKIGVIAGDVISKFDAERIKSHNVPVAGLNTGKECHLDAHLVHHGLHDLPLDDLDMIIIENVGNLVCPAEFDTGAVKNAMILSVPEGHDKPLKYPLIFTVWDPLIINKIDVLPYFDFDMEKVVEYAHMRNPNLKIFPICAKTGEGVEAWCDWLADAAAQWNGR